MMELKVENIPAYRIAYIRQTGPYGFGNVETMTHLKAWADAHHLLDDASVILGIAQDNPAFTKPESCRYDACIVISDSCCVHDACISHGTITGGNYAVFTVAHTAECVQNAWSDIFPEMQKQELQIDRSRPIIERYAAQMIKHHRCEICVPIC